MAGYGCTGAPAGYGYSNAYYSALAAGTAAPGPSSSWASVYQSSNACAGKKGDYGNMLEELKAKQAARTELREEQRSLLEQNAAGWIIASAPICSIGLAQWSMNFGSWVNRTV